MAPLKVVGVAAGGDVLHPLLGNQLDAAELALVAHQLSEEGHVPQAHAQAAAGKGDSCRVKLVVGVAGGSHGPPDHFGQELGEPLAGDTGDEPAQHHGVGGAVVEGLPVVVAGVLLDGGQILVVAAGAAVVCGAEHVARLGQFPDVGVGVVVVLAELDGGGHVHHLPHRGVPKA